MATVLESPDPVKSIDEINYESCLKIISKAAGLDSKPQNLTMQEKIEILQSLHSKKQKSSNIWTEVSKDKQSKVVLIEEELDKLSQDTESLGKSHEDYKENTEEIQALKEKLKKIKEKMKKGKKETKKVKVKLPKSKPPEQGGSSKGIKLEIEISNFLEQQKLVELHNHVTEIENAVGKWEDPRTVSKSIAELIFKTSLFNENLLDKMKEQSRHLENDLENLLSDTNFGLASDDNVSAIEKLSYETVDQIGCSVHIPAIIEKFRVFHPIYLKSVNVDKELGKFERGTETLEERIKEDLEALAQLKEGISQNSKAIKQNLEVLIKKLV